MLESSLKSEFRKTILFYEIWRFDTETALISWQFPSLKIAALNDDGEATPLVILPDYWEEAYLCSFYNRNLEV